jgi:hypothetical protein
LDAREAATCREQERERLAAKEERAEIDATVATCTDPDRLASLLRKHANQVAVEACEAAWKGLIREDAIPPWHDIVTVAGKRHLLRFDSSERWWDRGRSWHETGRRPGWHAPNVKGRSRLGVWLDAEGATFDTGEGAPSPHLSLPETRVVLPRGEPLRLNPWFGSIGPVQLLRGGSRKAERGLSIYSWLLDGRDYAQAIVAIINDGKGEP